MYNSNKVDSTERAYKENIRWVARVLTLENIKQNLLAIHNNDDSIFFLP